MNPDQQNNPDPSIQPGATPQFQPPQNPQPQIQPQSYGQQPFASPTAGPSIVNQPSPQMQSFDYGNVPIQADTPATPQFQPPQNPQPQIQPQSYGQQPFASPTAGPSIVNQPSPQMQSFDYGNAQYGEPLKQKGLNKKILVIAISLLTLLAVGILAFIGIRQFSSSGIKLVDYTSTDLGYSIKIPEGWSTEEKNERFYRRTTITEPVAELDDKSTSAKYRASIVIDYEKAESENYKKPEQKFFEEAKEAARYAIDEQKDSNNDSSRTKESYSLVSEKSVDVNGLKTYQFKLKVTNYDYEKDSIGYENLMAVYVNEETQYLISMSWHESEKLDSVSDKIISSFAKK